MNFLKKAAVAVAAMSMVATPVAASAADFNGLRAHSEISDASRLGPDGGISWLLLLLASAAIVAGIVVAADGTSDTPTSPG